MPAKKASKKKTSSKAKEEIKEITLEYKLHELPSSQHKAGLAGLYLMIEWLNEQDINKELIQRTEISETGLKVTVTKENIRDLFNELYKPISIRKEEKKIRKFKGKERKPLDKFFKKVKLEFYIYKSKPSTKNDKNKVLIEELKEANPKTGKITTKFVYEEKPRKKKKQDKKGGEIDPYRIDIIEEEKEIFIYDDTYPYAPLLCSFDQSSNSPEEKIWVKLWRDMMWNILRGVPATRLPYKDRFEKKEIKDFKEIWSSLIDKKKDIVDLPSTYYIGAQANNAENISFKDYSKNIFLLHFWPLVSQLYNPKKMVYDTTAKEYRLKDNGYVICIPDIARLQSFCEHFPDYMSNRNMEVSGYRPKESIVYLPHVAGYDSLKRIRDLMKKKLGESYFEVIYAQDILHCEKDGNNIRIRNSIRIQPDFELENKIMRYKQIYNNYLFQRKLIENVLMNKSELDNFYTIFTHYPHEYFFKHWDGGFKRDAKEFFNEIKLQGERNMSEGQEQIKIPKSIELLVFKIIQSYIYSKLESKHQLKWDDSMKGKDNERGKDFSQKKEKIAKEAFLAIRSRKDREDFITYFTSTICSVSQRLGEEGYLKLVQALYEKETESEEAGWEKIRALSMLALSANS